MASVEVYAGLASIEPVKVLVQLKLTNMLLHPYPKVRLLSTSTFIAALMNGLR